MCTIPAAWNPVLSNALSFKPGEGHSIALRACPTVRKFVFLMFASQFARFHFFRVLIKHEVLCVLNRGSHF